METIIKHMARARAGYFTAVHADTASLTGYKRYFQACLYAARIQRKKRSSRRRGNAHELVKHYAEKLHSPTLVKDHAEHRVLLRSRIAVQRMLLANAHDPT